MFAQHLKGSRYHWCREPRDRICAARFSPDKIKLRLQPSYSQKLAETCSNLSASLIHEELDLQVLCLAGLAGLETNRDDYSHYFLLWDLTVKHVVAPLKPSGIPFAKQPHRVCR